MLPVRMTTIFLIRHGLTAATGSRLYGRAEGFHLDERGRAQADQLAARFASVRLTAVYSSPLERFWRDVVRSPSTFRFPGGESFAEARARVMAEVERIARRHRRGRIAVATHGDIVRIVLADLTGTPLDSFQRIVIDPASVSVVHIGGDGPHVFLVNDTGGGLERFGPWGTATPREAATRATRLSRRGPPARRRDHPNLRG